jgi:hypothetical protein
MIVAYPDWDQSVEVPMLRKSRFLLSINTVSRVLFVSSCRRLRQLAFTLQLPRAIRVIGPTLFALSFAAAAHAQGTMDFSGAQTLMGTFKTFAIYAGAVICFGGLIFAGIRMLSGRFQDAIPGLFGALFGVGVLGWGAGWIGPPAAQRSPDGRGSGSARATQSRRTQVQH